MIIKKITAFLLILIPVIFFQVKAQDGASPQPSNKPGKPNPARVIGILSTVLSVSILLLVCGNWCQSVRADESESVGEDEVEDPGRRRSPPPWPGAGGFQRSSSGFERSLIESLPFFAFSSLKGSKKGLECAVCLSKFEDIEVLRLLPQCRHAFHINCIDRWLESHSSCPLCRCRFDVGDLKNLSFSNSLRFPRNSSNISEDPNLEIFVQREEEHNYQKFGIGRIKGENLISKGVKDGCKNDNNSGRNILHKLKHQIIFSDLIYKNRWSDLNSSDLMFLNSEMLNVKSSKRFSPKSKSSSGRRLSDEFVMNEDILKIKEDLERKRLYDSRVNKFPGSSVSASASPGSSNINNGGLNNQSGTSKLVLDSAQTRSMSEIINISRFADFSTRNRANESTILSRSGRKDEIIRKLWLPIATKTIQWFSGREKGLEWKGPPWNV